VIDGRQHYAWDLPDLHEERLDGYRKLRDDLRDRVAHLIDTVVPPPPPSSHAAFDADLDDLQAILSDMGRQVLDVSRRIGPALASFDEDELGRIIDADEPIDHANSLIDHRTLELIALRQPVAVDLRVILAMRQTALHLERIADGVVDIATTAKRNPQAIKSSASPKLGTMASSVVTMTETAMEALTARSVDHAKEVERQDDDLDELYDSLFAELLTECLNGEHLETVLTLDRVARALKRAGEHALDIAEQAVFIATGEIVELGRF